MRIERQAGAGGDRTNRAERPTLLALDQNDWFGIWMNRQQILTRMAARGWPVVFSNGRPSIWERDKQEYKSLKWLADPIAANGVMVHRAGKLHSELPGKSRANALTRSLYFASLRRALADLADGHAYRPPVVMIFHPEYEEFYDFEPVSARVLYLRDMYHAGGMREEGIVERLNRIAARSDLIFATTEETAEPIAAAHRSKVRIVPNGGSFDLFASGNEMPEPPELAKIPSPRFGFFGSINRRLDLSLVRAISRARPEWHWVLIGPLRFGDSRDSADVLARKQEWRETVALPNVHYFDAMPVQELPPIIARMDVNVLIYLIEDPKVAWVQGAYPLKLHDYLATGKPVVSVELENLRQHLDVIAFARGADEWMAKLQQALDGDAPGTVESRQAVARANDWDARVDTIETELQSVIDA